MKLIKTATSCLLVLSACSPAAETSSFSEEAPEGEPTESSNEDLTGSSNNDATQDVNVPNGGSTGDQPGTGGNSLEGSGGGVASTGGSNGGGDECTPQEPGFQNENAYVIDLGTCVHYQVQSVDQPLLSHADATLACEELELGGYADWRLPSVEELDAIALKDWSSPAVDDSLFPNTPALLHWTNDTHDGKVTTLDFSNKGNPLTNTGPDGAQAYRCVR